MSSNELNDVREFHKKFGMVVGNKPGYLSPRYMDERIALIREELEEFVCAAEGNDFAEQVDALIDMVYVIKGTAISMGISDTVWKTCWNEVQRSNIAKERGVGPRGNKVDVVKPNGWKPPRIEKVLEVDGFKQTDWFSDDGIFIGVGRDNKEDL